MNDLRAAIATLALIVLAATFAAPATAQDAYLELYARYSRIRSYGEAVVLPADRGAIALFTVRVPNSRLVFVRDREAPGSGKFLGRVEVTVQVRQGDRLVAERIWQTTHAAATYDRSVSRDEDLEASIPLALDPGDYRYRILVRDLNAEDLLIPAPPAPLHYGIMHISCISLLWWYDIIRYEQPYCCR